MKALFILVGILLSGCAPMQIKISYGSSPTPIPTETSVPILVPIPIPATQTSILSTPTFTSTPTVIASPTQTNTPTLTNTPAPSATPTMPKINPPRQVTFKFDDGIPSDQREFIQTAMAMGQNVFGDTDPFTVYAFADINALMDEVSRAQGIPRTQQNANALYRDYQSYFDRGSSVSTKGSFFVGAIGAWQSRTVTSKLSDLSFGYWAQVKYTLAGTSATGDIPGYWINRGAFALAQQAVLFKYGYADPAAVRREAMQQSRGLLSSLSMLEKETPSISEDISAGDTLGYLAVDYLAQNYGGELMVLRKYWENLPRNFGLQPDFLATFGMSTDDFYAKFEDYRRSVFPPYCGRSGGFVLPGANDSISLRYIRQDSPGAITFNSSRFTSTAPAPVAYTFCITGFLPFSYQRGLPLLADRNAAMKLPPSASWFSCGGSCILVYMPQSVAPGTYTFAVELPDRRRAEVQFQHSIPAVIPTPKP